MVKYIPMIRIVEYFYIFSKFITSIALLFIIVIMGIALYYSYNEVDQVSINFENKVSIINDLIRENDVSLSDLKNKMQNNDIILEEIKKMVSHLNNDFLQNKNNNNFDKFLLEIEDIKKQILLINNSKQQNKDLSNLDYLSDLDKQKKSLVNLILINLKNGRDSYSEIELLQSLYPGDTSQIFEKINVIQLKKFYGFNNLEIEFDKSTNELIKNRFVDINQNVFTKFIFNYIIIQPNNLTNYENKDLNILAKAKKFLELENIQKSLDNILLIDPKKIYFDEWIKQVEIYLEFRSILVKVG